MIKAVIRDIVTQFFLRISENGSAYITIDPTPPDLKERTKPFANFFRDENGSDNLAVDGSITPVDFSIKANSSDIYLKKMYFQIVDASMDFSKFGGLAALTNGCQLLYKRTKGDIILYEEIKTNANLAQATGDNKTGIITNYKGSNNGYPPILEPESTYGYPYGFKLEAKTIDEFVFRVRDDLTGLAEFNIYATGRQID